ncbi:hypothetical protein GLOIN_2v1819209 [Rhizophagus clarus]|uniref:Uncharacterized protein n=1 Tax=Rhizophagus clarus TaxID=94130 RepID=A0A8H3LD75_9GLOM|nr:hypothetical protein GLOIN_2v1819209 [Rhizophagus clarus]
MKRVLKVTSLIKKNINSKQEFFSVGLKGIINGIEKNIKEIDGVATKIAIERTLSEIEKIINYVLKAKICTGQMTEVAHASQEVLAKKIQLQRKKIANQEQIIHTLQVQLQRKVEEEEEKVSDELGQIAKEVACDWKSKWSQIPSNVYTMGYFCI